MYTANINKSHLFSEESEVLFIGGGKRVFETSEPLDKCCPLSSIRAFR